MSTCSLNLPLHMYYHSPYQTPFLIISVETVFFADNTKQTQNYLSTSVCLLLFVSSFVSCRSLSLSLLLSFVLVLTSLCPSCLLSLHFNCRLLIFCRLFFVQCLYLFLHVSLYVCMHRYMLFMYRRYFTPHFTATTRTPVYTHSTNHYLNEYMQFVLFLCMRMFAFVVVRFFASYFSTRVHTQAHAHTNTNRQWFMQ